MELAFSYSGYANLGITRSMQRELPYSLGAGDELRARAISETALAFSLISGALSAGLVVALAFLLLPDAGGTFMPAVIAVYASVIVAWQFAQYQIARARSFEMFQLISRVTVVVALVYAVVAIVAIYLWGIYGFLTALTVNVLLQLLLLALFQPRTVAIRLRGTELRRLIIMGLPMAAGGVLYTLNITADQLVVVSVLGAESLGVYSVAVLGRIYLWQVAHSFASVWQPRLQVLYGQTHDPAWLAEKIVEPCQVLAFSTPIVFGLAFLTGQLIVGLALPDFVEGVAAFQVLLLAVYLRVMRTLPGVYIDTIKRQNVSLLIGAIATAVSLLAVVLFLEAGLGLQGAAGGATVGALVHYGITAGYLSSKSRRPLFMLLRLFLLLLPMVYAYGILLALDWWIPWSVDDQLASGILRALYRGALYLIAMSPLALLLFRSISRSSFLRSTLRWRQAPGAAEGGLDRSDE